MNTRALLQSKDHSVGSKRYLSRLETRVESFASPRDVMGHQGRFPSAKRSHQARKDISKGALELRPDLR